MHVCLYSKPSAVHICVVHNLKLFPLGVESAKILLCLHNVQQNGKAIYIHTRMSKTVKISMMWLSEGFAKISEYPYYIVSWRR